MSLNLILENYVIFKNINRMLKEKDKINLSEVNRNINNIMNQEGYIESLIFRNDSLEMYLKFLEMYERHRRYVNIINISNCNNTTYGEYLPKSKILLKLNNCHITNKDLNELIGKYKIQIFNCYIDILENTQHIKYIEECSLKNIDNKIFVSYAYII